MEGNAVTRREARESAFLAAFSATFQPEQPQEAIRDCGEMQEVVQDVFAVQLLQAMNQHAEEIDALITAHLKGWALSRLPRVSLTAMRLALAEMLYGSEKKPAVAINEAVELVKKYGDENDYQFVNGLLGTVVREQPEAGDPTASDSATC